MSDKYKNQDYFLTTDFKRADILEVREFLKKEGWVFKVDIEDATIRVYEDKRDATYDDLVCAIKIKDLDLKQAWRDCCEEIQDTYIRWCKHNN